MRSPRPHITVCICTYQRPSWLRALLAAVDAQRTDGRFSLAVVVADNDAAESARSVVAAAGSSARTRLTYCVEPRRNIALARNRAIDAATGDFVAFIDDDEEPRSDWLLRLFDAIEHYDADGVLGPVVPRFLVPPPDWIVRGRVFERVSPPSGTRLGWKQTRTGNVLLRRRIFDDAANRFREEYGFGNEDVDFFRRAIARGMRFVWCAEAPVFEVVPAERCRRSYVLRRALGRGRAPYNQEPWPLMVSLVAIPAYALVLPVLLVLGQHVFMPKLISACDHVGRIVARVRGQRGTTPS